MKKHLWANLSVQKQMYEECGNNSPHGSTPISDMGLKTRRRSWLLLYSFMPGLKCAREVLICGALVMWIEARPVIAHFASLHLSCTTCSHGCPLLRSLQAPCSSLEASELALCRDNSGGCFPRDVVLLVEVRGRGRGLGRSGIGLA